APVASGDHEGQRGGVNHDFQTDGQVMYILAISLAAAEASIGLALLLQLHRRRQNLNIDSVSELRG
ncbi:MULTISPECIES: NADH-quinone oxidoreductase subunit K, partial [Enterobacter cloacae complex]|uniref:NADH-quinone oxidoreductase subunit K n=1 Tax=Enterobacter cloacae complex TaxID=354276 RepID=UPI000AAB8D73